MPTDWTFWRRVCPVCGQEYHASEEYVAGRCACDDEDDNDEEVDDGE